MTPENLQQFRETLLRERETLEKQLEARGHAGSVSGDWVAEAPEIDTAEFDYTVAADRIAEFETNVEISAELELRLLDVVNALAKIEDGTYGICEVSGEPIEEARLHANPAARTCIEHKEVDFDPADRDLVE